MINTILGTALTVAITVERLTELVKPLFLKAKSILKKKNYTDLTGSEKIAITIITGPVLTLVAGALGVQEVSPFLGAPPVVQQILIGLFASFGSNMLHPLIGLVAAFKDAAESLKDKNIWDK